MTSRRGTGSTGSRRTRPTLSAALVALAILLGAGGEAGAQDRASLEETIRRIDASEIVFYDPGDGRVVPVRTEDFVHGLGSALAARGEYEIESVQRERIAHARRLTAAVREEARRKLEALGPEEGSENPNVLIPYPAPHREPSAEYDWAVEGMSEEERCERLGEGIARNQSRLRDLEADVQEARRRMKPLDEDGWADYQALATALRAAAVFQGKEVADKLDPYFQRENIGALEEVLWDVANNCDQGTVAVMKRDWAWACGMIPAPGDLATKKLNAKTTLNDRVRRRVRIRQETRLPRKEQEIEGLRRELRAQERDHILLGCDDGEKARPREGMWRLKTTHVGDHLDGYVDSSDLVVSYTTCSDVCRVRGRIEYEDIPIEGLVRGSWVQFGSPDFPSRRTFRWEGEVESETRMSGTYRATHLDGRPMSGHWVAEWESDR